MKKFWKVFGKIAGILTAVIGVLFVVYFWNLDQKLLDWFYKKKEWFKSLHAKDEDMSDYADVDTAAEEM